MKKTNRRSQMDPHKRNVTGTFKKKQHRKEANNIVNNHHITWHDVQTIMMHVRFKEGMTWQSAQAKLQVKWSLICNELHIDKTPQQLFISLSFKYSTKLNVG